MMKTIFFTWIRGNAGTALPPYSMFERVPLTCWTRDPRKLPWRNSLSYFFFKKKFGVKKSNVACHSRAPVTQHKTRLSQAWNPENLIKANQGHIQHWMVNMHLTLTGYDSEKCATMGSCSGSVSPPLSLTSRGRSLKLEEGDPGLRRRWGLFCEKQNFSSS